MNAVKNAQVSAKVDNREQLERLRPFVLGREDAKSPFRPNETPVYAGGSPYAEARYMVVTSDRNWFWIRFSSPLRPPHDAEMVEHGSFFSKSKRLGYGFDTDKTPAAHKWIRELIMKGKSGDKSVAPVAISQPKAGPEPIATQATEHKLGQPKLEGRVPVSDVYQDATGRYRHKERGYFVSKERIDFGTSQSESAPAQQSGSALDQSMAHLPAEVKALLMQILGLQSTPAPQEVPDVMGHDIITPEAEEVDEPAPWDELTSVSAEADEDELDDDDRLYAEGFAAALADAEADPTLAVYDRLALARTVGMTVEQMVREVGESYIHGWLAGFESVRPKPVVKGFVSRLRK